MSARSFKNFRVQWLYADGLRKKRIVQGQLLQGPDFIILYKIYTECKIVPGAEPER